MDFLINLLPHVVNGLALGLLFALMALGFMLIISVMEVINLAHGSLFALGAYFALVVMTPDGGLDFPFLHPWFGIDVIPRYAVALIVAPVVVAVVGMGLEVCLRRTYGKDPLFGLLLTFGAALVIEEAIRIVWGNGEYTLEIPKAIRGGFIYADLIWSTYRHYSAVISIVSLYSDAYCEQAPPDRSRVKSMGSGGSISDVSGSGRTHLARPSTVTIG